MRYWLTRTGSSYAWLVELHGDRQLRHEIFMGGRVPHDWATFPLAESLGAKGRSRATYLDNPDYTVRPLPLTDPPLVSPLDFFAPRKE